MSEGGVKMSEDLELKPEEREKMVKDAIAPIKKLSCPCVVEDCPFRENCCLCTRNHRADNTVPACSLPRIAETYMTDKYPDCRSPLLWFLLEPDDFVEHYERLSEKLQDKIRANIEDIFARIA